MEIIAVPAFTDNYIWIVHDEESGETAVVDPGDASPALAECERRGWTITQVWNTHHHWDHTGGNAKIKEATGALVSAPAAEEIKVRDVGLSEGSELRIGNHLGRVIEIPGHTLGHVALVFDDPRMAFVGDTLFAMGCGRLFEGTAQQMHHSLQRIADLPGDTALYCGHEYTLANARFAEHAEPENEAIAVRYERVRAQREKNEITLPTTVSEERETNPFVRATNWEEFARLRAEKDSFRS
ncbi:MAG TPA: hydroxyacylglutathione hydrolase [Sphingomicrobium sp.]|jgi:hydroxyacylglutathione hydrolase|nr:hydroxyacylglutathione hydrolase [Sphingomicrobium sp.]